MRNSVAIFLLIFSFQAFCQTSVYIRGTGKNYPGNRIVKLNGNDVVNGGERGLTHLKANFPFSFSFDSHFAIKISFSNRSATGKESKNF